MSDIQKTSYFVEGGGAVFCAMAMLQHSLRLIAADPRWTKHRTRLEVAWLKSRNPELSPVSLEMVLTTLNLQHMQAEFVEAALRDPAGMADRLSNSDAIIRKALRELAFDYSEVSQEDIEAGLTLQEVQLRQVQLRQRGSAARVERGSKECAGAVADRARRESVGSGAEHGFKYRPQEYPQQSADAAADSIPPDVAAESRSVAHASSGAEVASLLRGTMIVVPRRAGGRGKGSLPGQLFLDFEVLMDRSVGAPEVGTAVLRKGDPGEDGQQTAERVDCKDERLPAYAAQRAA